MYRRKLLRRRRPLGRATAARLLVREVRLRPIQQQLVRLASVVARWVAWVRWAAWVVVSEDKEPRVEDVAELVLAADVAELVQELAADVVELDRELVEDVAEPVELDRVQAVDVVAPEVLVVPVGGAVVLQAQEAVEGQVPVEAAVVVQAEDLVARELVAAEWVVLAVAGDAAAEDLDPAVQRLASWPCNWRITPCNTRLEERSTKVSDHVS
jgi:hypothetical protein